MLHYLTRDLIIRLNQRTVAAHGGNFVPPENLLHKESLEYVLEAVQAEMFGNPLYPTVADKAAVYVHAIISNHVFSDGNKRTGLGAGLAFCGINNCFVASLNDPKSPIEPDKLYEFAMQVASGKLSLDEVRDWFAAHVQQR